MINDTAPPPVETLIDFINDTYQRKALVDRDSELVRSEIIDSYGILDLISFIESNFDLSVPDEDVRPDNFRTVDAMSAMIARLRSEDDAT